MKELSIGKLEMVSGGGFMDGACAVLGFTRGGMAFAAAFGRAATLAIPGAGQVMAVGVGVCLAYKFLL
jgi:hypothetical protein